MALEKNMNISGIRHFLLKGDMPDVIKYDIVPTLHLREEPGGYFGAPRQILCMVDFLGAMYSGKYKGKGLSKGAIKFIKEVMGSKEIDPNYKVNGELMYRMYRHGLVHLFQPKKYLLKNGRKIEWCVYKGRRKQKVLKVKSSIESYKIPDVQHLVIKKHPKRDTDILFICLNCLFADYKKSLKEYFKLIKRDRNHLNRWNKVATYISGYEEYANNENFSERITVFISKIFARGVGIWA